MPECRICRVERTDAVRQCLCSDPTCPPCLSAMRRGKSADCWYRCGVCLEPYGRPDFVVLHLTDSLNDPARTTPHAFPLPISLAKVEATIRVLRRVNSKWCIHLQSEAGRSIFDEDALRAYVEGNDGKSTLVRHSAYLADSSLVPRAASVVALRLPTSLAVISLVVAAIGVSRISSGSSRSAVD